MGYNPFTEMSNEELIAAYRDYLFWCDHALIPPESVLADMRKEYFANYNEFNYIGLMERDLLRECAKRFFDLIKKNEE